jgi:2-aminoethylphosphonate dioxygenase
MIFTKNQIKKISTYYNVNGFVIIKNFFKSRYIENIKHNLLLNTQNKKGNFFYYENSKDHKKILRRIEKISDFSKSAKKLINSTKIIKLINEISIKKNILFKDKLNFKYPGGAGYMPHIDGHFFWKDKHNKLENGWSKYSNSFTNLVIPLEKSTVKNGCLYVAKKKDTQKLGDNWLSITQKLEKNSPNIKKKDLKKFIFKKIVLNTGDILIFDWKCAHYSKENNSNDSRMIFYSTYCEMNKKINNNDFRKAYYRDKEHSKNNKKTKSLQFTKI